MSSTFNVHGALICSGSATLSSATVTNSLQVGAVSNTGRYLGQVSQSAIDIIPANTSTWVHIGSFTSSQFIGKITITNSNSTSTQGQNMATCIIDVNYYGQNTIGTGLPYIIPISCSTSRQYDAFAGISYVGITNSTTVPLELWVNLINPQASGVQVSVMNTSSQSISTFQLDSQISAFQTAQPANLQLYFVISGHSFFGRTHFGDTIYADLGIDYSYQSTGIYYALGGGYGFGNVPGSNARTLNDVTGYALRNSINLRGSTDGFIWESELKALLALNATSGNLSALGTFYCSAAYQGTGSTQLQIPFFEDTALNFTGTSLINAEFSVNTYTFVARGTVVRATITGYGTIWSPNNLSGYVNCSAFINTTSTRCQNAYALQRITSLYGGNSNSPVYNFNPVCRFTGLTVGTSYVLYSTFIATADTTMSISYGISNIRLEHTT